MSWPEPYKCRDDWEAGVLGYHGRMELGREPTAEELMARVAPGCNCYACTSNLTAALNKEFSGSAEQGSNDQGGTS